MIMNFQKRTTNQKSNMVLTCISNYLIKSYFINDQFYNDNDNFIFFLEH